jgi:hypothetical protein
VLRYVAMATNVRYLDIFGRSHLAEQIFLMHISIRFRE